MSKRILGLDLGTNSIGWGVVDDLGGGQFELIKRGVHIFQEGVKIEKGSESSKASERTGYRSARRIKFRRKLRKIETLKVLSEAGFCPPLSTDELKGWQSKKIYPQNEAFHAWCKTFDPKDKISGVFENPYYYRWLAATKRLDLNSEADRFKLGRAFYHMAQRRGFKSNRLDTTQESEGIVKKDISELSEKMNGRTLGQYFWEECYQAGAKIRNVHTSRDEHYLAEFEFICNKQGLSTELKEQLIRAIFYQRPLKSQKGLVANCPFEPKKKRAPISHPLFEEFRMWQTLNNIKIKTQDDEHLRPLSVEEKEVILPLFFRVSKAQFDFKDITKALMKTMKPRSQTYAYVRGRDAASAHVLFNYRDNQSLSGCPFFAKMKNLFGEEYKQAIFDSYCGSKQVKDGTPKSSDDILHEVWHVLFSFDDAGKTKEYAQSKLGLDDENADKFAKIMPKQGYGALSLKAIRKILPYLKQGLLYSHAVFFANLDQVIGISADENEKLKADISTLIDEHKQYAAEARCVNEFVREYKNSPHIFEESHDLRRVQEFEEKLPATLREFAASICDKIRVQTLENNGNGEYLAVKRLDERVGDYLKLEFGVSGDALEKLYHPSAIETYKPAEKHSDGKYYLGDPRISSIKNPVFMRAMHRVKAVVNELLKQGVITDQTQIHVEMARELNDANKRAAIKTWQWEKEKERKKYKENIEEDLSAAGITREATSDEILKYQLWMEQKETCIYTGQTIKVSDFIGANPRFDIEHTIPRSQSCDNSQENKTLCGRTYNRDVKKNRIPHDCPEYTEILSRIEPWQKEIERLGSLIEKKRGASRAASTKEAKDRAIQQRVVLEMNRNYLREKCRRFTMEEVTSGFKNSQLVDTRIITKYARLYLQTVFSGVHTVNGKVTDDFRRCWGIKKSRDNHAHHTVDAIVVACVTRGQYDQLARFYHEYESYEQNDPSIPSKPHFYKPWETFTEDMKNLKNEILVSHYKPNHLQKQTKRRAQSGGKVIPLMKDGVVQRDANGRTLPKYYEQGHTARGSLHKETFYGAIKRVEKNKKGESVEVVKYVVRKPLDGLQDSDVDKIVDDRIRSIVQAGRKKEAVLKKAIEALKKTYSTVDEEAEMPLREQVDRLEEELSKLYCLPNKNGAPIPIKKVRIITRVQAPLALKPHQNKVEGREHKQAYHVLPDTSFAISIYEGTVKGKVKRAFEVHNTYQASQKDIICPPPKGISKEIKGETYTLKENYVIGDVVLILDSDGSLNKRELNKRLYTLFGIWDAGLITARYHGEARLDSDQEKPTSVYSIDNPPAKLRMSASKFYVLKAGVDFELNVLGEVTFYKES